MGDQGRQQMKGHVKVWWIAICLLCLYSCSNSNHEASARPELALQPAGEAWGALYQQRAAEYKALCFQAYNIARLRLDQQLHTKSKLPLAIVTDIDETVLDNSPYFTRLAKEGKVYSDSSWVKWTAEIKCDTIPGASDFLKYAASKGVTVFYISNRFQRELRATEKNLCKWDLPNADSTHVLLMNNADGSKESRRAIVRKNYEIALLLGDNLGDFSRFFDHLSEYKRSTVTLTNANLFGNKFIVFPNVMYGSWEDVLYKTNKHANSLEARNRLLLDDLK